MVENIIEGINRAIEDTRATFGIEAKGYLKIMSVTEKLSFGVQKTIWRIYYLRPEKEAALINEFKLNYNPKRDDYIAASEVIVSHGMMLFKGSLQWEDIIHGREIQSISDTPDGGIVTDTPGGGKG